ncbi:hypothetical protein [Actinosynnema sp. NPDC020468]|uniref:hypothetical protein n=1 Tax=Actinosynnema sp. NPDC020468 TaxID=3154488 RepID=UPI0033F01271
MRGPGLLRRVLVPSAVLRSTWVLSTGLRDYGHLTADRADLLRIGACARLAAISPHSAVHVPLRGNPVPGELTGWFADWPPADLLFVREDVGFRPSAWPTVRTGTRRRPRAARAHTARTPPAREPGRREWSAPLVRLAEHGGTLVVSSSASGLHEVADLITAAGEAVATARDVHRHGHAVLASLTPVLDDRHGFREFDVYGLDPIFHRSRWAKVRNARGLPRRPASRTSG